MTPPLNDQLDFTVDSNAEPADLDAVLARFLLSLVSTDDASGDGDGVSDSAAEELVL